MDHNAMGGAPITPMPSMGMPHAGIPGGNRRKPFMIAAFAVVGILVIGIVAVLAMKMLGGSVKLETFSNENLSVLVPAGYSKTPENGGASFEEKEGASGTHSEVVAFYEKLPSGLSDSDIQQVKSSLKSVLQNAAESSASQSDQEIKNIKITDTKFKGDDALKLTGDAMRDGKTVGHYTLIAGVNKNAVYMVGVGVHKSDPGLGKKVDQILNSFTLK
jgi:hypothetical protein